MKFFGSAVRAAVLVIALILAAPPGRAFACDGTQAGDWLDTMIGQMLMFGFAGTEPNQKGPQAIARQLCDGTIGGVIVLGHNVKSAAQVKRLTALFKGAGAAITPLIAVDQEGGKVQRLGARQGYRAIPRAATVAAKLTPEQAFQVYLKAASQVRAAGFNVNLAPVVDVNVNLKNPIIGRLGRSFGREPETVIAYARMFIAAHHRRGILTALKHFPGHGSSRRDSHKGFVDISRTWQRERELAPFLALANDQATGDMVMSGHLYHRDLAPEAREPATLSRQAINGVLRSEMGYQGVVITDDLEMGAIRNNFGFRETIIKAVRAGNDILLISNSAKPDREMPAKVIAIIKQAVTSGALSMDAIEKAFERIRALKQKLAVLERKTAQQ